MRHLLLGLIVTVLTFLPTVSTADEGWSIDSWHSEIAIQADGTVQVSETIQANFGAVAKHGIFRDLPIAYRQKDGETVYATIDNIEVMQGDSAVKHQTSQNANNLRIKIGDPSTTISGTQTYTIDYQVTGAILEYDSYDELYWNVTGNGWEVPINQVSATVRLPSAGVIQTACYQGYAGVTEGCGSQSKDQTSSIFTASRSLSPKEGLTIAIGFIKGLVPILTGEKPIAPEDVLLEPLTIWTFALTTLAGLFLIITYWWQNGRDSWTKPEANFDPTKPSAATPLLFKETIVAEYEPPANLRPAELGTLVDERADTLDVSGTIIDLAVRGYLTISEIPKKWLFGSTDYNLQKTNKPVSNLLTYEQKLLELLFDEGSEVKVSTLKNTFYTDLPEVKTELYHEVTVKKLFRANPESIRVQYVVIGLTSAVVAAAIVWVGIVSRLAILIGAGGGLVLSGLFLAAMARGMPARTAYGRCIYRKAKGYELFINTADKYKVRFEENQNLFSQVLPYAIIFGVTKKFAKAMEEMGTVPTRPGWYVGYHPFSPTVFAANVDTFSRSLSTAIASSPSSSGSGGGGFSGGGFGGGGGGSW